MPYVIRPYKRTGKFRVCKRNTKKCFSRRPMSKRNAKRQLAAIYTNSGERHLRSRRTGGRLSKSRQSLSSSTCTYPYHITQTKLSGKDIAYVNTVVDQVKTFIGKYTPLALCHFIKSNKSLFFIKSKKCGEIEKALQIMKTCYKRLNIDSISSEPKIPLTFDKIKKMFATIFSNISTPTRSKFQMGGQERPNRLVNTLKTLVTLTTTMTLAVMMEHIKIENRITNSEHRGFRGVFNEDVLGQIPQLFLYSIGLVAIDMYTNRNRDNPADVVVADNDGELDIDNNNVEDEIELARIEYNLEMERRRGPAPANSFRIITRNSDMPQVPESMMDCGICTGTLVEQDDSIALKNTGGYIVQLHPGRDDVVPHLYHFGCLKLYFDSQRRQHFPTRCVFDQIDIDGHELVSTDIDERVNGTNFFASSSDP